MIGLFSALVLPLTVLLAYLSLRHELRKSESERRQSSESRALEGIRGAVQQLNSNRSVAISGITDLKYIALDNPEQTQRVLEELTGFIKQTSWAQTPDRDEFLSACRALREILINPRLPAETAIDFSRTWLGGVNLTKAQLRNANFNEAILEFATFNEANLSRASLVGAQLKCASFQGAELGHTSFGSADLSGVDFRGATFETTAMIIGANLNDARMEGVDLSNVVGLTQDQINAAIVDKHTKLPSVGWQTLGVELKLPEPRDPGNHGCHHFDPL